MANGILVFIEHVDGKINRASFEAVRAAQLIGSQLGLESSAVVLGQSGQSISSIATQVAAKKLKTVYTAESDWLKNYTADGYAHALRQTIEKLQPAIVLMTHTYEVRDFAPKLAASFKHILVGDCISYRIEDGRPVYTRQAFQGKLVADVVPSGDPPHFVSFQIGSFRGDECESGTASVEAIPVNLDADIIRQQPEERSRRPRLLLI